MSTKKSTSAGANKAIQVVAKAAIKATFPKAKLLAQFAEMADGSTSEKTAQELKTATAYMVCSSADGYADKAFGNGNGQSTDRHTILEAWRGHWTLLIAELNAAGNPFVELGEANKKGEQKAVMTGYGRNVASTARGVIEYDVAVIDSAGAKLSYRDIDSAVKKARRAANPSDLRTAKEALTEAITEFRKLLQSDVDLHGDATWMIQFASQQIGTHGTASLAAIRVVLEEGDIAGLVEVEPDPEDQDTGDTDGNIAGDNESSESVNIAAAG